MWIILILVLVVASLAPVWAQDITIKTDSPEYDHNSTITLEGKVNDVEPGSQIDIQVFNQRDDLVEIRALSVAGNGSFATQLDTSGKFWKYGGTYTIRVEYGSEVSDEISIMVTSCNRSQITASDQCIPFSMSGGKIINADIDIEENMMIMNIQATKEGSITIDGAGIITDINIITVDLEEWDDYDVDGDSITIRFPEGAEEIMILAASVVPEFGTVVMVLVVSIISIIAITRSKISVLS